MACQAKDLLTKIGVWDALRNRVGDDARKVDTAQLKIKSLNFGGQWGAIRGTGRGATCGSCVSQGWLCKEDLMGSK